MTWPQRRDDRDRTIATACPGRFPRSVGRDKDLRSDGHDSVVEPVRNAVDPTWRLTEVEEAVVLEALVAHARPERSDTFSGRFRGHERQAGNGGMLWKLGEIPL